MEKDCEHIYLFNCSTGSGWSTRKNYHVNTTFSTTIYYILDEAHRVLFSFRFLCMYLLLNVKLYSVCTRQVPVVNYLAIICEVQHVYKAIDNKSEYPKVN